jgi:mono/diheme cytochrome c family protein
VIIGGRMSGSYEIAAAEPTPVAETPAPEPAPAPAPEPAPAPAAQPAEADPALMRALMSEGQTVFSRNCARCHGADGEGGEGPRFIGYDRLSFAGVIISQVINGGAYMPPFPALSDRQIAAVATYIRNSFGNEFGIVTEDQVATRR